MAQRAALDNVGREVFNTTKRKRQGSNWIRRDKRWAIYRRDGFACVWCQGVEGGLTLDHLFPFTSRWRDNHARRLVTACFQCNRQRRDMRLAAWLRCCPEGAPSRLLRLRALPLDIRGARESRESLWAPLAVEGPLW